ncbi:MAG: response regulator [Acidobacteriota bacterium]|nr:response regulator [Acidobacteriota bacterium]
MKRILFVDDDQNVLDGIRRMLRSSRDTWEMEFVTGANAALQACSERIFNVVVSDLRMPDMDGAQLLSEIRERYPEIARVVLSGYSDVSLTAKAVPVAYQVLAKPCEPFELKETIERICTLQDAMGVPALRRLIGAIGELPSLSATYLELSSAIADEGTSAATIAKIVEQDVGLSAKILQVVNCGFFGVSPKASSVAQAVSYLGMDLVKTMALQSETFRAFVPSTRISASFWSRMQRHARQTAVIAGTLPVCEEIREVTLVAALLHDAGILALASAMTDQFTLVLDEVAQKKCSQVEAEESLLGITHAEIGAYLLGLWGINSVAVEAVANHHHPSRIAHKGLDCSLAVYLSNLIAHDVDGTSGDAKGEGLKPSDRMELETLGLLDQYAVFRSRAVHALGLVAQ